MSFRDDVQCSFINHLPDIQKIPLTDVSEPSGKSDVTKRFVSKEGRINDHSKVNDLFELRDNIFYSRLKPFQWNMESCVEVR